MLMEELIQHLQELPQNVEVEGYLKFTAIDFRNTKDFWQGKSVKVYKIEIKGCDK